VLNKPATFLADKPDSLKARLNCSVNCFRFILEVLSPQFQYFLCDLAHHRQK
jgi:hypothetical protein